jgi:hypothetical protein
MAPLSSLIVTFNEPLLRVAACADAVLIASKIALVAPKQPAMFRKLDATLAVAVDNCLMTVEVDIKLITPEG